MYGTLHLRPKIASGYRYSSRFPWVARLTGLSRRWGFQRRFMKPVYDYTYAAQSGKGMDLYYFLPPGLYEVNAIHSWKHDRRYFIRVNEAGEIREIDKDAALCHLQNTTSE